jgi:dodecin
MTTGKKSTEGESNLFQIITVIGVSPESWEKAAANAVEQTSKTLQVAATEGVELTMHLANGKVGAYIAKVKLSCKFPG